MENQRDQIQSVLADIKHKQKSELKSSILIISTIGLVGAFLLAYSILQVNRQVESKNEEIAVQEELNRKLEKKLEAQKEAQKYIQEGIFQARHGTLSRAIAAYDKAIEIDPDNAAVYAYKGYALLRRGEVQEAVIFLERSVKLSPNYDSGYYNLALAYWEFGDREKAIQCVKKALELNPGYKELIANDVQFKKFRKVPEFRKLLSQ